MPKVSYEWVIEESDAFGDIQNVDHADTFSEALTRQAACVAAGDYPTVALALLRIEYDDIDGELARHYAYLRADGTLPAAMETADDFADGPNVPQRFHKEVAR